MVKLNHGSVDNYLRPKLPAFGDGFGGPAVTSSRCGHRHRSLTKNGPRSGGRWDGCRQRSTPQAEQQHRAGDYTHGIIAILRLALMDQINYGRG